MSHNVKFNETGVNYDGQPPPLAEGNTLAYESWRIINFAADKPVNFIVRFHNQSLGTLRITNNSLGWSILPPMLTRQDSLTKAALELKNDPRDLKIKELAYFTVTPRSIPGEIVSKEMFDAVKAHSMAFCVTGRIEYQNNRGETFCKPYCLIFDGNIFHPLSILNDLDYTK